MFLNDWFCCLCMKMNKLWANQLKPKSNSFGVYFYFKKCKKVDSINFKKTKGVLLHP